MDGVTLSDIIRIMNILRLLYKKNTQHPVTNLEYAYKELLGKYEEILKYYCPQCKRGFERAVGKLSHNRFKHPNVNP